MLLETARLDLPEITSEDWSTVLAYQSDPRYLRYYAWTERTAADVQLFVQQLSGLNQEQHDCAPFVSPSCCALRAN